MAFRDGVYLARLVVVLSYLVRAVISARRPNIVVILADDLGWNDVSFHGSNQIPTPNIDALAYNGIILNSHYVPALCTPSRASLLTGKYPTSLGMQHLVILAPEPWGLPLEETLMPEHFKRHGYATHAVGKWHLGFYRKEYTPTYRGFDTHFGYWNGYQDYYDHTMEDRTLEGAPAPLKGYDMRRGLDVDYTSLGEYSTDAFTNEAVNIIKRHNSTQGPLFLYVAHLSPHSGNPDNPFQAPQEEIAKHSHIEDPERRAYAAMVTRLDEGVGRVVSALEESNLLENSIVIFMSDNGAVTFGVHSNRGSNYPLRGLKESPWEGGVRGVAAVWSPLLEQTRRVSDQMMHVCDWLPTLYSAAGLNTSELGQIDGVDMWETLSRGGDSPRTEVFNNYDEVEDYSSLRVGSWKYIEGTAQGGEVDLWYGESGSDADYMGYDVDGVLNSKTGLAIARHLTAGHQIGVREVTREQINTIRKESIIKCDPTPFHVHSAVRNYTEDVRDALRRSVHDIKNRLIQDMEEIRQKYPLPLTTASHDIERAPLDLVTDLTDIDEVFGCDPLKTVCLFNLETDPCERINLARIFPGLVRSLQERLRTLKMSVVRPKNVPGDPFCDPDLHNGTWSNWGDAERDLANEFIESVSLVVESRRTHLMDNVVVKKISSPVFYVFNRVSGLFIRDGCDGESIAPAVGFVAAVAFALTVYGFTKRVVFLCEANEKIEKICSVRAPFVSRISSRLRDK